MSRPVATNPPRAVRRLTLPEGIGGADGASTLQNLHSRGINRERRDIPA